MACIALQRPFPASLRGSLAASCSEGVEMRSCWHPVVIYHASMPRPMVSRPSAATLRKRAQYQRVKDEGRALIMVSPSGDTVSVLADLAELTGGSVKEGAEMVLRRAAANALREAETLAKRMGPIYSRARPYLRVARFLEVPGSSYRLRSTTFRADDWHPLAEELAKFHQLTARWGWSKLRRTRFLERAAEKFPG